MNIAVFASHTGSDLQAIIDGCADGRINGRVCAVISNNTDAYALERANTAKIDSYCVNSSIYPNAAELDRRLLEILVSHDVDMVFLAGYLKKISIPILQKYDNRIFNIHPALLPKYGGRGMFGIDVHRAVIAAGEKISGITIHRVNEESDSGDIVAQTKVEIHPGDTPEILAARILEREHAFLVEVINDIQNGRIKFGK